MQFITRTTLLALCLAAPLAQAQAVRTEKNMTLELANQIAAAGVAACAANGYSVAVTVVDRAGGVRAVQRADNAGPHTLGASQQKAFTVASAKNSTVAMLDVMQKNPGAAAANQIAPVRAPSPHSRSMMAAKRATVPSTAITPMSRNPIQAPRAGEMRL